jgi:hypothetical protein
MQFIDHDLAKTPEGMKITIGNSIDLLSLNRLYQTDPAKFQFFPFLAFLSFHFSLYNKVNAYRYAVFEKTSSEY